MEALIHHFKLFTEGYCVPAGRDLCGGRGAEGRVRLLHRSRRRQQAVPRQAARAGLRPPVLDGRNRAGHMLADVVAMIGTYDVVFGRDRPMKGAAISRRCRNVDPMQVLSDQRAAHIEHWVPSSRPTASARRCCRAVRGAGAERRLAHRRADRRGGEVPRPAAGVGLRGRDLLFDVRDRAGRPPQRGDLHQHQLLAQRRRGPGRARREEARLQAGRVHRRTAAST
jgi:hypothetical protein